MVSNVHRFQLGIPHRLMHTKESPSSTNSTGLTLLQTGGVPADLRSIPSCPYISCTKNLYSEHVLHLFLYITNDAGALVSAREHLLLLEPEDASVTN